MAIEKNVVDQLIDSINNFDRAVKNTTSSGSTIMAIDDITVVLGSDSKLEALVFECMGRDFSITKNYDLTVLEQDELGEAEVFVIADPNKEQIFSVYLQWRTKVLSRIGV